MGWFNRKAIGKWFYGLAVLFAISGSVQAQTLPCDTSLWQHVYHRYRLQVKQECKTVTGVVRNIRKEKDGDLHIQLRLDSGQEGLLNEKNYEKQDSCLVIEIVCTHNVTQTDAVDACEGYVNGVPIPARGEHVSVTGSYVYDAQHGWNEIHPVVTVTTLQ